MLSVEFGAELQHKQYLIHRINLIKFAVWRLFDLICLICIQIQRYFHHYNGRARGRGAAWHQTPSFPDAVKAMEPVQPASRPRCGRQMKPHTRIKYLADCMLLCKMHGEPQGHALAGLVCIAPFCNGPSANLFISALSVNVAHFFSSGQRDTVSCSKSKESIQEGLLPQRGISRGVIHCQKW